MDHVESLRLLELAEMSAIVDRSEWDHIKNCYDCGLAFVVFKGALEHAISHSCSLPEAEVGELIDEIC